jgi:hypothetical protein
LKEKKMPTLTDMFVKLIQNRPATPVDIEKNREAMTKLLAVSRTLAEMDETKTAAVDLTVRTRVQIGSEEWPLNLLQLATYCGNEAAIDLLLSLGASVKEENENGTVLWLATYFNQDLVTAKTPEANKAATDKQERIIKAFLARGADVNYCYQGYPQLPTALHIALQKRNYNLARLFLLSGAKTDISAQAAETAPGTPTPQTAAKLADGLVPHVNYPDTQKVKDLLATFKAIDDARVATTSTVRTAYLTGQQHLATALNNDIGFTFDYLTQIATTCAEVSEGKQPTNPAFNLPKLLSWAVKTLKPLLSPEFFNDFTAEQCKQALALHKALEQYIPPQHQDSRIGDVAMIFESTDKQLKFLRKLSLATARIHDIQELQHKAEQAQRKAQEEAAAQKRAEEDAKRKAQENAERNAKEEAEARKRAEAVEAQRKEQEETAKKAAEDAARQQAEEAAAQQKAQEEAERKAQEAAAIKQANAAAAQAAAAASALPSTPTVSAILATVPAVHSAAAAGATPQPKADNRQPRSGSSGASAGRAQLRASAALPLAVAESTLSQSRTDDEVDLFSGFQSGAHSVSSPQQQSSSSPFEQPLQPSFSTPPAPQPPNASPFGQPPFPSSSSSAGFAFGQAVQSPSQPTYAKLSPLLGATPQPTPSLFEEGGDDFLNAFESKPASRSVSSSSSTPQGAAQKAAAAIVLGSPAGKGDSSNGAYTTAAHLQLGAPPLPPGPAPLFVSTASRLSPVRGATTTTPFAADAAGSPLRATVTMSPFPAVGASPLPSTAATTPFAAASSPVSGGAATPFGAAAAPSPARGPAATPPDKGATPKPAAKPVPKDSAEKDSGAPSFWARVAAVNPFSVDDDKDNSSSTLPKQPTTAATPKKQ